MAPPRRRTRSTGMSPGAMGGKIGSPVTSKPKPSTMSPGERRARTGFAVPKQDLAKQFFKGPVSDDRLRRRLQQDREERDFISQLKVAPGTTNLLQEQAPVFNPMTGQYERTTLAQKRQQLANLYGPTPREVLGDIGYGIKSIAGGLGQKFAAGELGIMGIAKGLYEQFTNRAAQAKNFLGDQVNKLSDIDLEFLKNEGKYNFMSKKPSVLKAKEAEALSKQADANLAKLTPYKNLFGDYYGFGGPSMPGEVKREELGSIGIPTTQPTEEELNIIRGASISNNYSGGLGQTPTFSRTAEMIERNPNTGTETVVEQFQNPSPSLLNALAGQEQVKKSGEQFVQGLRDIGYFEKGGSVDSKLNEIQKSTNNIYGTGILSVR